MSGWPGAGGSPHRERRKVYSTTTFTHCRTPGNGVAHRPPGRVARAALVAAERRDALPALSSSKTKGPVGLSPHRARQGRLRPSRQQDTPHRSTGSRRVRLPPSTSPIRSDGAGVLLAGSRPTFGLLRGLSASGSMLKPDRATAPSDLRFGPPGSSCPKLPADPGTASRRGRVEVAGPRPVGPTAPSIHCTMIPKPWSQGMSGKTGSAP